MTGNKLGIVRGETSTARLSIVRSDPSALPSTHVATIDGDRIRPSDKASERIDFIVSASGRLILSWE